MTTKKIPAGTVDHVGPTAEDMAMLQAVVSAAITQALTPVMAENIALKERLDKASTCMKAIIAEVKALRGAKRAPATPRIPVDEFNRALEDLRAEAEEAGSDQRFWPTDAIRARAAALRTMERNTVGADSLDF